MPWKECSAKDERLRFVARLLEGEGIATKAGPFGAAALHEQGKCLPRLLVTGRRWLPAPTSVDERS
jgi:hypothetical protein